MTLEKMSKSKGNVVRPEEVVGGVFELHHGFEFRDRRHEVIDHEVFGIWRSPMSPDYWTSTRTGRRPVWLCIKEEPVPPLVMGQVQHAADEPYWTDLLARYEHVPPRRTVEDATA